MTRSGSSAVSEPLSPADEELLAVLLDELSETRGGAAVVLLERHATAHPQLSGQLRELFAAMSMADAVAEQ